MSSAVVGDVVLGLWWAGWQEVEGRELISALARAIEKRLQGWQREREWLCRPKEWTQVVYVHYGPQNLCAPVWHHHWGACLHSSKLLCMFACVRAATWHKGQMAKVEALHHRPSTTGHNSLKGMFWVQRTLYQQHLRQTADYHKHYSSSL